MRFLFVGDVVGKPGRAGLAADLPRLIAEREPDLVIVNGENAAGGVGITEPTAEEIFAAGADVITLGNHSFRHRDVFGYLDRTERILRPANYERFNPGHGTVVVEAGGLSVGIINLSGQVTMRAARNPFTVVDELLSELDARADAFIVDFHAEVTSEKVALGWHLDGRVAAVLGTHTHVPTADARVLPGGTAHISDVGMTGSREGVLGARRDEVLAAFRTQINHRFHGAEGDVWINAVLVEVGSDGLARSIEQILRPAG